MQGLTVLLCNAWARYRTPTESISLRPRSSVVSVYIEQKAAHVANDLRRCHTVLLCNALAKDCVPATPIRFR